MLIKKSNNFMKISDKKFIVIQTIAGYLLITSCIIFPLLYHSISIYTIHAILFALGIIIFGVINYKDSFSSNSSVYFPFILWLLAIGVDLYANYSNIDFLVKKFDFYLMTVICLLYLFFVIYKCKPNKSNNITIVFITSIILTLMINMFYMTNNVPWQILIPLLIIMGLKSYLFFRKEENLLLLVSYITNFTLLILMVYITNFIKIAAVG